VFPGVEDLHPLGRQQFLLNQQTNDLGTEEFIRRLHRRI
jgi:hypothetical protein